MSKTTAPWPVLKSYDANHLFRIALPLGGVGTGTVSLGGRGDLRDWEIMNRPGKKFVAGGWMTGPSAILYAKPVGGQAVTRLLEGPMDLSEYEGASGATARNHGLPRFRDCSFAAAYPLGQVMLADRDVPLKVRLEAFNPMIPGDSGASGIPVAVLRYMLVNKGAKAVDATVCMSMQNFIGADGHGSAPGCKKNRNAFVKAAGVQGISMTSEGVDSKVPQWGTMALVTTARGGVTYRTRWNPGGWNVPLKDFWEDISSDGKLTESTADPGDAPDGSLAVSTRVPARGQAAVTFLLTWHFPNRQNWGPNPESVTVGNYYATQYKDAVDVAEKVAARLAELERRTVAFVRAFCDADVPDVVKEAALFNAANLRTQTVFRIADGHMFGWEGYHDHDGCCMGSCTHVWNYEQATAFLFGDLAMTMRDVEFAYATEDHGGMCFRADLPLTVARKMQKAAADGQMGCLMKMYRDWQLSGDEETLRRLWPNVKKSLAFCWVPGGWDGDQDGVMEGCQHNTMDVEYYGPNPQMEGWYLGALRAGEEMARHLGDNEFADRCRKLFEAGKAWTDEHLFNGEYYEHEIRVPADPDSVPEFIRLGGKVAAGQTPLFQLGNGCLVDQLVGQFMAHVCGLGYLLDAANIRKTLRSIRKYNRRSSMAGHFNNMRGYAVGDESALLMASYPKGFIPSPFPYYSEVMTGFEYAAAVGMLQEGQTAEGLESIADIRNRYDGAKRSPFNEAECGHHYARAMAAWAAVLAMTEFQYSAVGRCMSFTNKPGRYFWSNGYAWGTCTIKNARGARQVELTVDDGRTLELEAFALNGFGGMAWAKPLTIAAGKKATFTIEK